MGSWGEDSPVRGRQKGGWTPGRARGPRTAQRVDPIRVDGLRSGEGSCSVTRSQWGASCGLSREAAEDGRGVWGGAMSEELIGQRRCPLIGPCSCHSVAAPPSFWSPPPTRWWSGPWRILVL